MTKCTQKGKYFPAEVWKKFFTAGLEPEIEADLRLSGRVPDTRSVSVVSDLVCVDLLFLN
jgi:hypothetical protein